MANTSAAPSIPAEATAAAAAAAAARLKTVRTGCLKCRDRHWKCDEGVPDCQTCKNFNRVCKRGVKTPLITPPIEKWDVVFQDESREMASEYQGGLSRYSAFGTDVDVVPKEEPAFGFSHPVIQVPTRVLFRSDTVNCHVDGGWTPHELVKDAISAPAAMDGFYATPDTARGSLQGQRNYTQNPASQLLQESEYALPAKPWSSAVDYSSATPFHHTYPKNASNYKPREHYPNVCPPQGSQPPHFPRTARDIPSSYIYHPSPTILMSQLPDPPTATTPRS